MNCREFNEFIEDFLSGEADERHAVRIESHILVCENCEALFDRLTGERETFSHFLFEIEPPKDLTAKFNERLAAIETNTSIADRRPRLIAKLAALTLGIGFRPAFAAAALLLVMSAVIWFVAFPESAPVKVAGVPRETLQQPTETSSRDDVKILPRPTEEVKKTPEKVKFTAANEAEPRRAGPRSKPSSDLAKNAPRRAIKKTAVDPALAEIRAFEIETDKQIEKVELLLRSFRNARYGEGREEYDIEYEAELARRLLEKNVALRRRASDFGARFADEMLGRIEPYLIGIANLDKNPSDEEVLEIKQRVRNENIIASLQGF